ncbi:MAG: hypothetical protein OXC71_05450 [Chloroflexi bacterium]|nr:hypothetical protein [Chloroflexota bacterium]
MESQAGPSGCRAFLGLFSFIVLPILVVVGAVAVIVGWLSGGIPIVLALAAPSLMVAGLLIGRVRVRTADEMLGQRLYMTVISWMTVFALVVALTWWLAQ